jgi:sulfur-oxidizing protein SoxY
MKAPQKQARVRVSTEHLFESQGARRMRISRRELFGVIGGAAALVVAGLPSPQAFADAAEVDKRIEEFAAGAKIETGRVTLTAPEIAENGNTVPVTIAVESPMTKDDYVKSVLVLAAGNPRPGIATFNFSPLSGEASATTRIRLATTQDVIAVAKMSDGQVFMDRKTVKVTIGGCGG